MSIKTDLAKEIINKISPDYAKKRGFLFGKTEISEIFIETDDEANFFGKPKGKYVTVEADFPRLPFGNFDEEVLAIASELRKMLPEKGSVLAVGIGNSFLNADSLGPLAVENLLCGDSFGRKLFSLVPGVFGRTGIEPEILIKSAVEKLSPSAVILVDSLAAENPLSRGKLSAFRSLRRARPPLPGSPNRIRFSPHRTILIFSSAGRQSLLRLQSILRFFPMRDWTLLKVLYYKGA